jgi:class 3 adenylate cyclase
VLHLLAADHASVALQPSGTVTLVFTDIEGSTALLDELGALAFKEALADHRRALREAFGAHSGYEVDDAGDGLFYAFAAGSQAVTAVAHAMASLADGPVRIRVGVHTGEPLLDPPKYVGPDVHKAARIMSAAHGGQVLLSGATRELVAEDVLDLGRHRLKDFPEPVSLYQLGPDRFPPLRTISNTNLPVPLSSFVGREQEMTEVVSLIRDEAARLVTLAGPGGTGKTRLALEAAGELVSEFGAGVFWIGLSPVRDPELVVDTIAQTLGAKQELAAHIGEKQLLLVLDNLEQVVDSSIELAAVLKACPNLRLLVTSRELMRVDGEVVYPVPALAEPDAVELFCAGAHGAGRDRCRAVRPAGQPAAGARARRRPRQRPRTGADPRAHLAATGPVQGRPRRRPPSADAAGDDRLVVRPALAGRAAALRPAGRLPRRLHARGGRGGRGRKP